MSGTGAAGGRPFGLARILLAVTIVYNVIEGVVALWAGLAAGSIALIAFGADSYLEVAAAALVLWRLSATERSGADLIEERVRRFVG